MLRYAGAATDIVPSRETWHVRTRGELNPTRIEAWRATLDAREFGLAEQVLGRRRRANGYALGGDGTGTASGTRLLPRVLAAHPRDGVRRAP